MTPAAPHMPAPAPALPAFSRISAFARSSSCRTSVVVSFASCLSSSATGRSRRSAACGPLDAANVTASSDSGTRRARQRRA